MLLSVNCIDHMLADIDECAVGSGSNRCFKIARCNNTMGNYTCSCPEGHTGDGYGETGCEPDPKTTNFKPFIGM